MKTQKAGPSASGRPGAVVFSIDVELAWGCFYRVEPQSISARLKGARETLRRLLQELQQRRMGITWAFVGHLFLEECDGRHGSKRRIQAWYGRDWYGLDPGSNLHMDPEWYGADMVRLVNDAEPGHEIAAHGFSHCFLDDPAVSMEIAAEELTMTVAAAAREGIGVQSFVYPRNRISHTGLLKEAGFKAYRTKGREMGSGRDRGAIDRMGHLLRQTLGVPPEPEEPRVDNHGLVEIPGTNLYLSTAGWRSVIPVSVRVRRALRGMDTVARHGGLFHLWCHLEDFLESSRMYFSGFLKILDHAARLRDRGDVKLTTMRGIAGEVL